MMLFNPKLFQPMPDEVFERTPPRLRVRYMVKRVLNQAQQRAGLERSFVEAFKRSPRRIT